MGVGDAPKYGTLEHRKLHVGREVLVDGEKTRPYYLGTMVDLRSKPAAAKTNVSTEETDGATRQSE